MIGRQLWKAMAVMSCSGRQTSNPDFINRIRYDCILEILVVCQVVEEAHHIRVRATMYVRTLVSGGDPFTRQWPTNKS